MSDENDLIPYQEGEKPSTDSKSLLKNVIKSYEEKIISLGDNLESVKNETDISKLIDISDPDLRLKVASNIYFLKKLDNAVDSDVLISKLNKYIMENIHNFTPRDLINYMEVLKGVSSDAKDLVLPTQAKDSTVINLHNQNLNQTQNINVSKPVEENPLKKVDPNKLTALLKKVEDIAESTKKDTSE